LDEQFSVHGINVYINGYAHYIHNNMVSVKILLSKH